jgi:hypothetical protein
MPVKKEISNKVINKCIVTLQSYTDNPQITSIKNNQIKIVGKAIGYPTDITD